MASDTRTHEEIPVFGRQIKLGSLYDCVTEAVTLHGSSLPEITDYPDFLYRKPQLSQSLSVLREDTFDQKLAKYGAEDHVRLSYLSGLIPPGHVGQWINAKPGHPLSARVTLHYRQFTHIEGFKYKQFKELASLQGNVDATHLVIALSYGVDLFTDFVVPLEGTDGNEDKILDELEAIVQCVKRIIGNECRRSEVDEMLDLVSWGDRLVCSFHGDIDPRKDSWNIDSCISFYQNAPLLMKVSSREVPLFAWIVPISRVFPKAVGKPYTEIDPEVCRKVIEKTGDLEQFFTKARKLLQYEAGNKLKMLTGIDRFLCAFEELFLDFKHSLRENILEERSGNPKLESWLQYHTFSGYDLPDLENWLTNKDEEESFLKSRLRPLLPLKFVEEQPEYERICLKEGADFVVCLQFFSATVQDKTPLGLEKLRDTERPETNSSLWFEDDSVVAKFDETLNNYEIIQCLCAGKETVLFVMGATDDDDVQKEAARISFYCWQTGLFVPYNVKDFEVSGLICKRVKKYSVTLKWQPVKHVTFVHQLICCWKESGKWNHQTRQEVVLDKASTKVSLQGLTPAQEYDFKVVCVDVFGRYHDSEILMSVKTSAPLFSFGIRRGSTVASDEKDTEFVEVKMYD